MTSSARSNWRLCTAATFVLFGVGGVARAQTWTSIKTNGLPDTLATAQVPLGNGPLTTITGNLSNNSQVSPINPTDADLYKIIISDPVNFSAIVKSGHSYPDPGLDTELYLFDANGYGVEANEDKGLAPAAVSPQGDGYDFTSWLPAYSYFDPYNFVNANRTNLASPHNLAPGIYYLAISPLELAPVYDNAAPNPDQIFAGLEDQDQFGGATFIVGATAGSGPLLSWYPESTDAYGSPNDILAESGSYEIDLTGATFAVVPEPSSIGLAVIGFGALLLLPRVRSARRRRCPFRSSMHWASIDSGTTIC